MVPAAFVVLERFPLTPNGKLDRKNLLVPEVGGADAKEYAAPRNELEELLAGIFEQVLRAERVGVHENFFELGGHSLLATQVESRVSEFFPIQLPLRVLFEQPTVEQLSQWIELASKAAGSDALKIAELVLQVSELSENNLKTALIEATARQRNAIR